MAGVLGRCRLPGLIACCQRCRCPDRPNQESARREPGRDPGGHGRLPLRCADCHGMDARGVRGPDITQVWARAAPTRACSRRPQRRARHRDAGVIAPRTPITRCGRSWPTCARWPRRRRPIRRAATPRTARRCFARSAPAATGSTAAAAGSVPICRASASRASRDVMVRAHPRRGRGVPRRLRAGDRDDRRTASRFRA